MKSESQNILMRIFVGEYDKIEHTPLYEQIVYEAKKAGLAGATVTKGVMSFGADSLIHKSKILALSEDLPMIIEIVDTPHKIEAFKPELDHLFDQANCGGLVTQEKVTVTRYGASTNKN